MPNRNQRYKEFNDCEEIIETLFNKWVQQSSTGQYFKENFGLVFDNNLTEGSNAYASFSIKWEDRPFDLDSSGNSMAETGAKIEIRQSFLGYVSIAMYPASTTYSRQVEDFVVIRYRIEPFCLYKKWVIFFLWEIFLAYSTVTSIDTTPSLCSRILVRLLRYIRPKCVNGIITESGFWHAVKWMFALAFTLVTSSLFVYFMQAQDTKEATLIQSSFYHKMDSIVEETNAVINQKTDVISEKLDSIVLSHKQLSIEIQDIKNKEK